MEKKKKYAAIVGYGNRGQVYASYSLDCPEEFGVAAVIDPNDFKLHEAKEKYRLSDDRLFRSFDEFAASGVKCDFVINTTMDQCHYETTMKILNAGYDVLLEKPIVPNEEELRDIQRLAEKKGLRIFVCHVLRYAPFYKKIKELINAGEIGKIMTIEMNEHVCISHYLTSYVRGKWNSEEKCGSGFLLAKSCHDLDLMCWLNGVTAPKKVASFGSRSQFIPENAPEGAADFCYKCKYDGECPYSSTEQYLRLNVMPFLVWDRLNKPLEDITTEEKREFLKKDIYGRCAYTAGGDLIDRQNVIVDFENGSCGTFDLVGGTTVAGRYLHVVGTKGEIEGKLNEDKFLLRKYSKQFFGGEVKEYDVSPVNKAEFGGHNGGDFAIMHDLLAYLNGDRSSISITSLSDSVNGHLCVFAAEKSRRQSCVVEIESK